MKKTAKQLAEELGVSATTVSLAFRGSKSISKATRERVLAAAEAAGMEIPESTPETASVVQRDYAMICSGYIEKNPFSLYPNPFIMSVIRDMGTACVRNGARLMTVFEAPEDLEHAPFDGYFVYGEEQKIDWTRISKPVIYLDKKVSGVHSVSFDQDSSIYQLADFIKERALRPFFMFIDNMSEKFNNNYHMLRWLLSEKGMTLQTAEYNLDRKFDFTDIDGQRKLVRDCAQNLAKQNELPDMIICSNDCFAGMLQVELRKYGIQAGGIDQEGVIPLVGYDDIPYVPEAGKFITFRSDIAALSDAAVRLMNELLNHSISYRQHIQIETEMIVR